MGPAGVIDDDVELVAGFADEPRPVGALGDVALDEASPDLLCHAFALRAQVVDDDLRTFLGEAPRDAGAEARGRAGNDGHLVFQPHDASLNGLCSASSST